MAKVSSSIEINAPREHVWELAQDIEAMPQHMADLDEVKVLSRHQLTPVTTRVISDWHGRIKQMNRKMWWTEEDIWNSEEYACHFWQLKGDFTSYKGVYRFLEQPSGTRVELEIEYTFEIPLLGALLHRVVEKLMQENCNSLLAALKKAAEETPASSSPSAA